MTLTVQPNSAKEAATLERIDAAVTAGNMPLAQDMARAALVSGLMHPKLLHLRSFWWAQRGRNDEAIADLRQAVAIAPSDVLVRHAYGVLLAKLERWPESIAELRAAIEVMPDFAPARVALAWSQEAAGDLDGARRSCETAIALDSGSVEALVRLARLAIRRADWETARAYSERALAFDSNHYTALATKATLAIMDRDFVGAEALIGSLLGRDSGPTLNSAMVKGLLGDLRHVQGRYDEAYAAYSESNLDKYKLYAPRYGTSKPLAHYGEWLSAFFEAADRKTWSASGVSPGERDGAKEHVFLIGFPRSGTTLLEAILASHQNVCVLSERDAFVDLRIKFLNDEDGLGRLAALGPDEMERCRAAYWRRVREFGEEVNGKVFVDKMPLATLKLPLIAKLFPRAKVIFARRDPRDVVLSCFRRNFGMNHALFEFLSLERTARFYGAVMRFAATAHATFDLNWHETRNEALIRDFEGEARAVCDFISVEWDARMHAFAEHASTRTLRTPSSTQIMRGVNSSGVDAWRHYEKQIAGVMPILQPWIVRLGYPQD